MFFADIIINLNIVQHEELTNKTNSTDQISTIKSHRKT